MKKNALLNSEISYVIANMRHTDMLVIGDSGLPVPPGVPQIDLAVTKGIPDFLSVLKATLSELRVEKVILAEEISQASSKLHEEITELFHHIEKQEQINIEIQYVTHEDFKAKTIGSKAVVRTGECTPYANIILVSGVVF
ncbi:D-ribose pyranase [Clostridium aminobutyricum]|uniref:D-ribose pyranase n=1 Tax=Clostridium aminobutyricum TaxID=33953 RepID=A0A939D8A2_CLOAM|nr:D-ribose pyranase [Clostridium aminobutyricum]MBN7772950.1 D-ribose pyranase [Clostridium aminobutyricum]